MLRIAAKVAPNPYCCIAAGSMFGLSLSFPPAVLWRRLMTQPHSECSVVPVPITQRLASRSDRLMYFAAYILSGAAKNIRMRRSTWHLRRWRVPARRYTPRILLPVRRIARRKAYSHMLSLSRGGGKFDIGSIAGPIRVSSTARTSHGGKTPNTTNDLSTSHLLFAVVLGRVFWLCPKMEVSKSLNWENR